MYAPPPGVAHDLGDAHPKALVDDHDFAVRDEAVVDQDVDRLAGQSIELHDRAGSQAQGCGSCTHLMMRVQASIRCD